MSSDFDRPLRSVRRRLALQAALDGAAFTGLVASAGVLVAVYLWRLGWIGPAGFARALIAGAALIAAGAAVRGLRRVPLERAAKRIDNSHALHDRFGSALAFVGEREPTPFMVAAIDDARRAAARVDARRAAPLRRPRGLGVTFAVLTAALIVAFLRFPEAEVAAVALPPRPPRLHVDADLLAPEREAAAQLEADARDSNDKDSQALAEDLKKLLQQLDAEELTRKQVFDKLAEIEKKLKGNDGDFEELKRALKQAGAELGKEKLTKEMGDALAKEDLATAKKELEKLAAEAEKLDAQRKESDKDKKDALKEKDREPLARSLDRAAKEQQQKTAEEKKREAEEKRLKEEERRLKKELAQKPNDRELERKLQRNQRELQRLERDKQQRAEQKRQLERLQRELQKAAEQLRQKLSPEAAEALRKAAQQMGQMENEIRKLGNMSKAQVQIAELKEMLRRAGQSQPGQDGQSSPGQGQEGQGQQGQGQSAQNGQNGKGRNGKGGQGTEKELMRQFNDRAGGGQKTLLLGGKGGDGSVLLPLPLPGIGGGDKPGQDGKGGGKDGQPGDGIGDQHDPNLTGDKTQLAGKRTATRVQGKEGAGPSKSETILGSAEKGFATRNYRRVYSDYNSVVEEVMSKERVPPGYRFYIKRYFQLIRPRD